MYYIDAVLLFILTDFFFTVFMQFVCTTHCGILKHSWPLLTYTFFLLFKYREAKEEDRCKINIVKELIEVKNGTLHVETITIDEASDIL